MGEIIVRKIRGVSYRTKLALIAGFTMLLSTFVYQGWYSPASIMAGSVSKTFVFTSSAESWVGNGGTSTTDTNVTTGGNPGGAIQSRIAGKNRANATAGWYLTGITWESLGVPAGSIVTSVNASYDWRCSENVLGDPTSESGNFVLADAADGNQTTLVAGTTFSSTTAWATRSAAAIAVPSALQASGSSLKLSVLGVLDTTADTTAAVTRMLDNISLTITYTTPAIPVEAAGSLVVAPQAGSFVDSPFTITEDFTSTQAVNMCQYTINGGTAWTDGAVSGTGPYTCTAGNVSATNGTALTIQMRASNTGGASWSTPSASLSKTVDTVGPTDGGLTATAAGSSQINLNWTVANDTGSGLNTTTAYKVVRADATTTPPTDCSGPAIYQGSANSYNDSAGLAASTPYAYRVCAYDALNNQSVGATVTATTQAGSTCTANVPGLVIAPASSLVAAGANMLYTATVTNNDSGAGCGNVPFDLALANSNTTDFTITAISPTSLSIAPAGQGSATFTVTAKATAADGAINTSTVSASASGHTAPPNATAQTTVNSGSSPLLHSSANLDPQNLKGYGAWGTSYDCSTCHSRNSSNVKRIQDNIVTPRGSRPVVFYRMTASAADAQGTFGDDLRTTYANASRNVCEVCHHQTLYHQYSSTKIADRSTNPHYNRKDCTSCHPHSAGFKGAGCDGCHGNPPTSTATLVTSPEATLALGNPPTNAGAHDTHVNSEGMKCVTCHNGNTMPTVSKTIQVGFDINNTNWPGFAGTAAFGSFSGRSPLGGSPAYTFVSSKSGTAVNTSSSYRTSCNVYCHGQWTGANGSINPSWIITDGSQSACGTCHGATASNPPATGKHATHASNSAGNYGFSCTKCHPNANGFSHVNGSVQWRLSSSSSGLIGSTATYTPGSGTPGISGQTNNIAPSATYGTCTNIYCHSTAQGSTGTNTGVTYTSPKWSDAALGCGGCHADMSGAAGTGDHVKHANTYGFACANCHGSGYTGSTITTTTHVNRNIDLKFSDGTIAPTTTYSKTTSFPAGSAIYGNCSNSYCHSNGQSENAKAAIYRQPVWGTTMTNCGSCHNNMKTFANASSGSHLIHAQATGGNYDCAICHNGYTATTVNSTTHVDKKINLGFTGNGAGTAYSKYSAAGFTPGKGSYGTCGNNKCHGGAAVKIVWGGDTLRPTCFKCHGSTATTGFVSVTSASVAPGGGTAGRDLAGNTSASAARLGAHQPHMTSASGISDTMHCTACHIQVNSFSDAAHLNYTTATVSLNGLATANSHFPTVSRVSGLIQCSNTYCHTALRPSGANPGQGGLNNTPNWNNTAFLGNTSIADTCTNKCHAMPPGAGVNGDTHGALATVGSTLSGTVLAACSSQTGGNGCHPTINAGGASISALFYNRLLHINGQIEGGTCVGCHNTAVGGSPSPAGSRRRVTASAAGNGEFTVASATAYTNMTSHIKTTAVSTLSCQFCHEQSSHKTYGDGASVKLQNTWAAGTIVYNGTTASLTYFCTGCHRSAGYGGTIPSGALGTATQPYKDSGDNNTPDDIFSNWSSSAQYSGTSSDPTGTFAVGKTIPVKQTHRKSAQCMDCHGDNRNDSTTTPRINAHASSNGRFLRYSTAAGKYETQTCFNKSTGCHGPASTISYTNARVFSDFKVNNASAGTGGAHPILVAVTPKSTRISTDTAGANFVRGWKSNSIATCADCHGGTPTGPRGPHGSALPYLLMAVVSPYPTTHTNGTSFTAITPNTNSFCLNCHAGDVYGDGNGGAGANGGTRYGHGSTNGWSGSANCGGPAKTIMNNSCQNCHCGNGYTGTGTKGTHSTTAAVGSSAQSGVGFVNGNIWVSAPTASGCYPYNGTNAWGTCSKSGPHASSDRRFKQNFQGIMNPLQKIRELGTLFARIGADRDGLPGLVETVREQQRTIESQQQDLDEVRRMLRQLEK